MKGKHFKEYAWGFAFGGVFTAAVAFILAATGFLADVVQLITPFVDPPAKNKVVAEYGIDGSYVMRTLDAETLEFAQSSSLAKPGYYYFDNKCATEVILRNMGDSAAIVTSVTVRGSDIVQDWTPYLYIHDVPSSDGIELSAFNRGWGDFPGGTLILECEDVDLLQHLKRDTVAIDIPSVKAGEKALGFATFSSDEISQLPDDVGVIGSFGISVVAADQSDVRLVRESMPVYIVQEGFRRLGRGDYSEVVFGMCIDASKPSFEAHAPASADIPASGTLHVPIIFFPSMSCDMNAQISFTISYGEGKEDIVTLEERPMHFDVDKTTGSVYLDGPPYAYDLSVLDELSNRGTPFTISFPYGLDEWYEAEVSE